MNKKDILLQLIQHYTFGNKTQFATMIGLTPQALGNMIARNKLDVERILTFCVNVNPAFLLTGQGPITLEEGAQSPTVSSQKLNNANLDQRINELLVISNNLCEMFKSVNDRLAEAAAIINKSQQQFDRVLDIYQAHGRTRYGVVAEDITQ